MAEEIKKEEKQKEITLTLNENEATTLFYALTATIGVLGIRSATAASEDEMKVSSARMDIIQRLQVKINEGLNKNVNQQ